jgi:tetratricopeptide (TPR) repeat protein
MRALLAASLLFLGGFCSVLASGNQTSALESARDDLQHGRYPEARKGFETLIESADADKRGAAVVGLSETLAATGELTEATAAVKQAVQDAPTPLLWARLGELQFLSGDFEAARESAETALKQDTDQLRARLVLAHVNRETGRLDEALDGYRWFVRYYNREQPKDAQTLRLVAEGSLEYARWKRVSSVFHFVVNTLCPDALKADPDDWQTYLLSGDLLLEKYNQSQARSEFEAALKINPEAAEAHAALARAALQDVDVEKATAHAARALAINPQQLDALRVRAEVEFDLGNLKAAERLCEQALKVRPTDQGALAVSAAIALAEDGLPEIERFESLLAGDSKSSATHSKPASRFEKLLSELVNRNPSPGVFLDDLGMLLESRRKYAHAERLYAAALDVMPQLASPRTNLGLLYMRIGRVDEAQQILDEAFKADPFHVRVSNMRKVIGVLQGYEVIRTEHFIIRVDASDKLLGEYMADYLEEVHDELSEQYGYTPPTPTQFEVYSSAKGQSAHQWFSARMIGLPWIQTIGASTGRIVALASPNATEKPYHWARVLRHEYVHILTLQQTDFNIPHWYTEALATRTEGLKMPDEWKELLLKRVPSGDVFTLSTVNSGFQRPDGPDDWDMAYCQSRQYAQFLEDNWGAESLTKLLHAYRDGLETEEAILQATGLSVEEFEARYREHLNVLVREIRRSQAEPTIDVAAARAAYEADDRNPTLAGRVAYALLEAGENELARQAAEETRVAAPREPFATAVLARLAVDEGDSAEAVRLLSEAHMPDTPHPVTLAMFAEQCFNGKDYDRAAELYDLGVQQFPLEDKFWKGLTVTYLARKTDGDDDLLRPILEELSEREAENTGVRRKLAQIALARNDFEDAHDWAREVLFVDLEDADAHAMLGRALWGLGKSEQSRREFELALEYDGSQETAHLGLARIEQSAGNFAAAVKHVREVLNRNDSHAEAQQLLRDLQGRTAGEQ